MIRNAIGDKKHPTPFTRVCWDQF